MSQQKIHCESTRYLYDDGLDYGRDTHMCAEVEGLEGGGLSTPALVGPCCHLSCALIRRLLSPEHKGRACWQLRLDALQAATQSDICTPPCCYIQFPAALSSLHTQGPYRLLQSKNELSGAQYCTGLLPLSNACAFMPSLPEPSGGREWQRPGTGEL